MFAIICTLVFAGTAGLSLAAIAASWKRHGAQAVAILRTARCVPDAREFRITVTTPAAHQPADAWPQLRRQPRRLVIRGSARPAFVQRAAA